MWDIFSGYMFNTKSRSLRNGIKREEFVLRGIQYKDSRESITVAVTSEKPNR